ncbi:MAG: allantoin racemase [Mucilaginibacter sp.]|nr:allantoin racemase [Mucilaginibacter sp.]
MQSLHVINPNSSAIVTATIAAAGRAALPHLADSFVFATLVDGPDGIVTQEDADRVAPLVTDYVREHATSASGFVIACYSDPGLFAASEVTTAPVVGLCQAGLAAAMSFGTRIGVIAVSRAAIPRHMRYYGARGLRGLIAGERAIDLPVAQSGDERAALGRIIEVATALRDRDGADVIVLGCAGMSNLRPQVEAALGVPVIDPVTAAIGVAVLRLTELGHV